MKRAMILAAGFGTRLLPYSKIRPKPLFPIMGRPLLLHIIAQLRQAGFTSIIVNAHHLREQISDLLKDAPDITIQREDVELGTGGGLRLAMERLGTEPVLITNGDIYHNIDYRQVYDYHLRNNSPITLVMHDYPRFNKVHVAHNRIVSFNKKQRLVDADNYHRLLAFTGIQIINPEILVNIKPGVFTDIIPYYEDFARQNKIASLTISQFWHDMGTPDDYLALHKRILSKEKPGDNWLICNNNRFYRASNSQMGQNVSCKGWGIIGSQAIIGDDVSLRNVVVWDKACVPAGTNISDSIIT